MLHAGTYRLEDAVFETVQKPMRSIAAMGRRSLVWHQKEDNGIDREGAKAALMRYYVTLLDRVMSVHRTMAHMSALRLLEQERGALELFVLWFATDTVAFRWEV